MLCFYFGLRKEDEGGGDGAGGEVQRVERGREGEADQRGERKVEGEDD